MAAQALSWHLSQKAWLRGRMLLALPRVSKWRAGTRRETASAITTKASDKQGWRRWIGIGMGQQWQWRKKRTAGGVRTISFSSSAWTDYIDILTVSPSYIPASSIIWARIFSLSFNTFIFSLIKYLGIGISMFSYWRGKVNFVNHAGHSMNTISLQNSQKCPIKHTFLGMLNYGCA